jgi:hypothetical protein
MITPTMNSNPQNSFIHISRGYHEHPAAASTGEYMQAVGNPKISNLERHTPRATLAQLDSEKSNNSGEPSGFEDWFTCSNKLPRARLDRTSVNCKSLSFDRVDRYLVRTSMANYFFLRRTSTFSSPTKQLGDL